MFDLFGNGHCEFWVDEDHVLAIIIALNSFNVSSMDIVSDDPSPKWWYVSFNANPDVIRAFKMHIGDSVKWESPAEEA